jgi:hypothetical protein
MKQVSITLQGNMTMAVKSSAKENKDDAFKVLPNQDKVHESGRGEVAW